jgi:hypothetical protein
MVIELLKLILLELSLVKYDSLIEIRRLNCPNRKIKSINQIREYNRFQWIIR